MLKHLTALLLLLCSAPLVASPVDFSFTDLQGKELKMADYRGKWIVLNYWATWCPPCLEEIPELVHFHETHKDSDGMVIGIAMENLPGDVLARFVEDNFMTYPIVPMVEGMPVIEAISSFPTTFLIDPDGMVVAKRVGTVTTETIEAYIDQYEPNQSAMR